MHSTYCYRFWIGVEKMFFDDLAHRELAVINDIIDDTAKRLKKYGRLPKMTLVFRVRGIERIDYYGQ